MLANLLAVAETGAQEERAIDHFAGVGVRAIGMGGAYVGVADDFTALFWNPAGLAQLTRREMHVAFLRNGSKNDATLGGTAATSELSNTRFGSLGFVYPYPVYRGSFVLAAGFNRYKDFDWSLRTEGFVEEDSLLARDAFSHEGELTLTSLAGAVDVSPSMSLGVALNIVSGNDEIINEFESTDTRNHFDEKLYRDREVFSDLYKTAFTATFGALVRTPRENPRVRVGATVTTGATHRIHYTKKSPPVDLFSLVEYDDGRVETATSEVSSDTYSINLPLEIGVGVSFKPVPSLLMAAGLHIAEWSQAEYRDTDVDDLRANSSFERQYRDTVRWHLGAEWQVPMIALDLRAGFYTDPLTFVGPRDPKRSEDDTQNPKIQIEQDRRFVTLGAGLSVEEAVSVELAYAHGTFERIEGPLVEKVTVDRLMAGVVYEF